MAVKKLTRSANKKLAGVLAGIAEYCDIDVTVVRIALVRLVYMLLTFFSAGFPGLLLYILMALMMPGPESKDDRFDDAEVVK